MLKTPEKIRELQRKLYQRAKQDKRFRFYSLYDKVYRADILSHAYKLVKANKGGPGIDGLSFIEIEQMKGGVEKYLDSISDELKAKTYKPMPVKRVFIPKPDGKRRRSLTSRRNHATPTEETIRKVNEAVRGWTNYFYFKNCSKDLSSVKGFLDERIRIYLRHKHRLKSRGYKVYPYRYLYGNLGLYKIPATAPWTQTAKATGRG